MNATATFKNNNATFAPGFSSDNSSFGADFGNVTTVTEYKGGEEYKGAYEVTPKVEAQVMPTKDKVLVDDMTVKEIPFFKVSNTSGGNTVYIGSEV